MKKTFTRTIIVLIIVSLITAGFAIAQDVIQKENQEAFDKQTKEVDFARRNAELAEKMSQKESEMALKMKAAEKQMKEAEKQMGIEQKVKDLMLDIRIPEITLPHLSHFQHSGGGGGILVIPAAEMKVENLAGITEDMSVMSRIIDKKVSQSNLVTSRGRRLVDFNINPFLGSGNRATEAIYLEGYGALFLMEINILLSAPPEAPQNEKTKEEDTDPVWSQMRREMYEPEDARRSRTDDRPKEKYDAEMVETLKTNLIKTLKHATNIQALKSEQLVILTVIGDKHRSGATVTQSISYGRSSGSRGSTGSRTRGSTGSRTRGSTGSRTRGSTGSRTRSRRTVQTAPEVETGPLLPTVLTISAKKSDIDAFAKGELDYDQFRQRTGIFKSYARAGQNNSPGADEHQVAHEIHR